MPPFWLLDWVSNAGLLWTQDTIIPTNATMSTRVPHYTFSIKWRTIRPSSICVTVHPRSLVFCLLISANIITVVFSPGTTVVSFWMPHMLSVSKIPFTWGQLPKAHIHLVAHSLPFHDILLYNMQLRPMSREGYYEAIFPLLIDGVYFSEGSHNKVDWFDSCERVCLV